ncbi:hydrogen peroxide-dependent heme synthase [Streptomyces sp. NPDC056161]|uniref:hydrogen peroxide-dependent heme synthase n=1 Tax=Streptomyces sp. NPDC056161 TaxID=3345732 RepID=UPI0035D8FE2C
MSDNETAGPAFTLWNVYSVGDDRPVVDERAIGSLSSVLDAVSSDGVVLRGMYDVSGLRAGADLMIWLHGADPERLQSAARVLRHERVFTGLKPVWHAMGVHREAEFNPNHVPAFIRGVAPAKWLTVYPFNRSYEWYLLPEEERRDLLAEHGRAGAAYRSVLTNTVSAFALGDYEWILPLEADDPIDLVDMMRTLRATRARLHVREETPFFTGRRIELYELYELLGA